MRNFVLNLGNTPIQAKKPMRNPDPAKESLCPSCCDIRSKITGFTQIRHGDRH